MRSDLSCDECIAKHVRNAGMGGISPQSLVEACHPASRSTINRCLSRMVSEGQLKRIGAGRGITYISAAPFSVTDIINYLAQDYRARPVARYQEELLLALPNIDKDKSQRLSRLSGLASPLDQRFLSNFLIDFSWGSSLLEGGTYSDLDTQVLLQYGQRNPDKPVEDAILVLNHKQAIEYLWNHRELTEKNLCILQGMLTDPHNLPELENSDHFLPENQRGVTREYEDVNLGRSAYQPPFRPGTGYIARMFSTIVATANSLAPIEAAFYLMTRIPYLQAFANGNKRCARLASNLPLITAGMLPISFVDFNRAGYIRAMAAFYELGTTLLMENVFIRGYVKSIVRGSDIPVEIRVSGFNLETVADELVEYVMKGSTPKSPVARAIWGGHLLPPQS